MKNQTAAASLARRTNAARRRFNRYADEMRLWGCTVIIPDDLKIPTEKADRGSTPNRPF